MNPLTNAKIVGENVDPRVYHTNIDRGSFLFDMSASHLKSFLDSPEEWREGVETDDTKSTDWGNIIDCMVLSPERWRQQFAVCPETYPDKKTGEQKPWNFNAEYCKKWRDDHAGLQIVKYEESNAAVVAQHTLKTDSRITDILGASKKQLHVSAEYHSEEGELVVPLKGLIDIVPVAPFDKSLIDFKTCRSVHPRAFKSHVHEYGYALSAALYLDLYNAATGEKREDFRFIIQKNSAPWTTGLRLLNNEWLEYGRRQYVAALNEYAICLKENKWPSHEERAAARGEVVIDGFMMVDPEIWMVS